MDFYLNDLLSMSDAALRDYFGILDAFKNDLKLSEDSEAEYVISKLLKLSQKPSMFASETAETQFTFINDVFSLPTSNTDVINSIVVRLLPFVDANHYMEAFNINFGLYRKLNSEKESDRQIMTQIEENLVQNYTNATAEEKKELFGLVFKSEEIHSRVAIILEKFVEINNIELDSVLVSEYIKLYEEFFESEWKSALYWKIVNVFKECDIPGKVKIWNRMCNSANPDAKNSFIYNILRDEDEPFHKVIFDALVMLLFHVGAITFFYVVKNLFAIDSDYQRKRNIKVLLVVSYMMAFLLTTFIANSFNKSTTMLCIGLVFALVYFGNFIVVKGTLYGTVIYGAIPWIMLEITLNSLGKMNSSLFAAILFTILFWCACSVALSWKDTVNIKAIAFEKTKSETIINGLSGIAYFLTALVLFV